MRFLKGKKAGNGKNKFYSSRLKRKKQREKSGRQYDKGAIVF